ncbi:hypothetical protein HDU88_004544 [Geranomyces variabilis]|nr:hypothetical protein HDU88_004544 [Geranomyces variabilis]
MPLSEDVFTALLGTPLSSPIFAKHLEKNHPPADRKPSYVKTSPATLFYNFKTLGISYSFDLRDKDPATARLAAIHCYSGLGASAKDYASYCLPVTLPHGIDLAKATGRDVVLALGEPSRKSKVPSCCLVYDGEVGFQVDLLAKDWEDPNARIECLTLWKDVAW